MIPKFHYQCSTTSQQMRGGFTTSSDSPPRIATNIHTATF